MVAAVGNDHCVVPDSYGDGFMLLYGGVYEKYKPKLKWKFYKKQRNGKYKD